MVDYQILGRHGGKELPIGGNESAAQALGIYKVAIAGSLPVKGIRITADGVEIDAAELLRRANLGAND